ncbi:glycosyl hydrolase, putative [Phytophthora infestans T30-4]|uniref:Glycosyl hydrolase, putative n=1 Tax=Phytophthora infestans (strain T30-4) TaxID=403677 RepID=D0NBH7_PHYIT|nr:glycosyl hydrolase, putative [Phytophthora infestans T30-4]EEY55406.1 glycosyl hydrolase, putative [Phytophthora infestans T30-4]|eukprot:XP_002903630.1 glycosyl hydrolase, putative [Phytophthora infestans T30-4]
MSQARATTADYALGPFTVTVDTDASSVTIVNGVGDQVWKCGVGRGEEPVTTYFNENASISGAFDGGSLLTTYTDVGSLTTSHGRWVVLDGTKWLDGRAAKSNPLLEATNALAKVTGRQPESPDWSHDGAILGGQDFVEEVVQNDLSANMPLMSVWLQNWPGTRLQTGAYGVSLHRLWWNWEPDMTLYPTWARWVPHLQSTSGVRTMSYINTFLTNVSTKSTGYNTSFYEIAVSEGRFVANAQPAMVKQYYSVPISGMMQDCGEYLSVDDSQHSSCRCFGTHSDIGGYTNTSATVGSITRNTALLGRWGELGAFSGTAFRTHEGNIPQMNAQAFNARLFRSLNPYRLPLLDEYQMNDWPLVRHPMVYSSNDSVARAVIAGWARLFDSQGTTVNSTAFAYKHLWSGEEFAPGQTVRVDASWGKPGVFMRWPVTEKEGLQLQQLWEFVVAENATALLTEA